LKWAIIALTIICLIAFPVESSRLIVNPGTIEVDIIGGSNITKNITVRWDGQECMCYLDTLIEPDTEGINVTYSLDSPFLIKSNTDYVIKMFIQTRVDIVPKVYTIKTDFHCNEDEKGQNNKQTSSGGSGKEVSFVSCWRCINGTREMKIFEGKQCPNGWSNKIIDCGEDDPEPDEPEPPDEPENNDDDKKSENKNFVWLYCTLASAIIFLIILLLLSRMKKGGNEK